MRERTPPVREIAWRDVCPWLLIVEAAGAAFEVRKTLIATFGLAVMLGGWWAFGTALLDPSEAPSWSRVVEAQASGAPGRVETSSYFGLLTANPLYEAWSKLTTPFQAFVTGPQSWNHLGYAFLCGVWALVVWAFFAAIVGRMSAMQLGREEPASIRDGVIHARRKYWDYATAPLIPLGGALFVLLAVVAGGWLLRSDAGATAAGVLAGPALLLGWFAALLVAAAFVGWPLMWSAIGVDRCDNFGSFSTTYSFLSQRPLHAALYIALAGLVGAFLIVLVAQLAALAVGLTFWAAGWTGGAETVARLKTELAAASPTLRAAFEMTRFAAPAPIAVDPTAAPALSTGGTLILFWCQLFALAVAGFGMNYLFTAATAIYLVLRHDVDRTEFDAVDVDKPAKPERAPVAPPPPAGLPIVTLEAKRP